MNGTLAVSNGVAVSRRGCSFNRLHHSNRILTRWLRRCDPPLQPNIAEGGSRYNCLPKSGDILERMPL